MEKTVTMDTTPQKTSDFMSECVSEIRRISLSSHIVLTNRMSQANKYSNRAPFARNVVL